MKPSSLHLVLTLAWLSATSASAAPASTEEQVAASLTDAYQLRVHEAVNECAVFYQGKGGEYFQFLWNFWSKHNEAFTTSAADVLPDVSARAREAARSALVNKLPAVLRQSSGPSQQSCQLIAKQVETHELDVKTAYPAQAAALQPRIAARKDLLHHLQRDADFTVGCMKSSWNRGGRDAEVARKTCECITDAIVQNGTDDQISAWLADLAASKGKEQEVVARTPWFQKAMAAAAACNNPAPR